MATTHYERIEGIVYCQHHGGVHEYSLDPYEDDNKCTRQDHRAVYFLAGLNDEEYKIAMAKRAARKAEATS